jgi:D-tyrosyl-tRNA(Tyr) deacylase
MASCFRDEWRCSWAGQVPRDLASREPEISASSDARSQGGNESELDFDLIIATPGVDFTKQAHMMPVFIMKAIIQRAARGSVSVEGETIGSIGPGYVVLLGVREGDTADAARALACKTVNLRIFADDAGKMNRSIQDIGGSILVISQFTLYADTRKGNRPSFIRAAAPELAEQHYELYTESLRAELGTDRVQTGRFGAMMQVDMVNDGPVTIELSTD